MKKYCTHCGAILKISQMMPPGGMPPMPGEPMAPMGGPPLGGMGGPPLGGPMVGGPMAPITPEQELNNKAKEEIKKTILDIIEDEDMDTIDEIYEELQDQGWDSKRLRELFPEKEGGIKVFIEQVIEEEAEDLESGIEKEEEGKPEEKEDMEEIEEEKKEEEDEVEEEEKEEEQPEEKEKKD